MRKWYDSQKKPTSNFRKLLQEWIEKANPRRALTAEEQKRLSKLETIAARLRRGESVQNPQLQTWLSDVGIKFDAVCSKRENFNIWKNS